MAYQRYATTEVRSYAVDMASNAGTKTPQTTIKVPVILRQRIASDAADEGVTAAVFLTSLVDRYEREQRLAAVGRAYLTAPDDDYTALTQEWDALSGEDVEGA